MKAPCKDCPDRHELCHSECEKYKTYRAEKDKQNEERRMENAVDGIRVQRTIQLRAHYAKRRSRG